MVHCETALCNPGLLGRVLDWVRANADPGSDLAMLSREELRHIAEDLSLAESRSAVILSWSARQHCADGTHVPRSRPRPRSNEAQVWDATTRCGACVHTMQEDGKVSSGT